MSEAPTPPKQAINKPKKFLTTIIIIMLLVIACLWFWFMQKTGTEQKISSPQTTLAATPLAQPLTSAVHEPKTSPTTEPTTQNLPKYDETLLTIEHLIQMANVTLVVSEDYKTALNILILAKQYAVDPRFTTLNQAITKDISVLQAIPKTDATDLIARLDVINQQISSLSLLPNAITEQAAIKKLETKPITTSWETILINIKEALKELVIIRHNTVEPLPTTEQLVVVRLNLQTKLLQAEWAVLHQNNKLYQSCLTQISESLTHNFALNPKAIQPILTAIKALTSVNPSSSNLAVTNSLQAISDMQKKVKPT